MTLKEEITLAMSDLAKYKDTVFLGENVINSGRIYGTLDKVPLKKCIEMPICENLIAGMAIGLAVAGYHPICIFQRMDFMLIAADAIINHAALIPKMSGDRVRLPIIFRTIKAELNDKFWVGHQHSKDFTHVFKPHIIVIESLRLRAYGVRRMYQDLYESDKPILVVEDYKDFNIEV